MFAVVFQFSLLLSIQIVLLACETLLRDSPAKSSREILLQTHQKEGRRLTFLGGQRRFGRLIIKRGWNALLWYITNEKYNASNSIQSILHFEVINTALLWFVVVSGSPRTDDFAREIIMSPWMLPRSCLHLISFRQNVYCCLLDI